MSKPFRITTTVALALGLGSATVLTLSTAQADEHAGWYIAPAVNYVLADDDRNADDDVGFQIGVGKYLSETWNIEASFEWDKLDIDGGGEFDQKGLALNGLLFFERDPAFSPYGLIGAGGLNTKAPGESGTNPLANLGLGFLSNVLGDRVALRGEARYRWDDDGDSVATEDSFGDWVISFGVNIPLGGTTPAAAPQAVAAAPAPAAAPVAEPVVAAAPVMVTAPEDSDGDGVADSTDGCPDTPAGATVDAQGCEPDSDGDGVADSADRCPDTQAGVRVGVRGCEIKEVTELPGVNFETGSARLLPESMVILDDVAATLRKYPDIKAEVTGHTDNSGTRELNTRLSQQRAESVMNYLVSKGAQAANLTARGYGPDHPVADNATDAGRAANRRVEMRLAQ